MKHFLLFLISIVFCNGVIAQDSSPLHVTDSTEQEILKVLNEINTLQKEANEARIKTKGEFQSSIGAKEVPSNEYGAMLHIATNTKPQFYLDGWNLFGIFTFFVALFSTYYAFATYRSQKKTEQHTQNAPISVQIGILKDLPRHFYRNLVCTCALLLKFRHKTNIDPKNKQWMRYPSESNLLKLSTLPDDFILPIDSIDEDLFQKMHEGKLLFKNYNMEIEVASKHLATRNISDNSLQTDYDNLLFKPLFLVARMFKIQNRLNLRNKKTENNVLYAIYAIVKVHTTKAKLHNLLNDKEGELSLLKEITKKDDSFVKAIGIKPDSIQRGLNDILNYNVNDNEIIDFLSRKKNKLNPDVYDGEIDKAKFIVYFEQHYKQEEKNDQAGLDYFKKIISIKDEDDFCEKFNMGDLDDIKKKGFHILAKNYFGFFAQEKWDVKELIFTILKIDTILETSKIGMIEYK